jgi:choline kinase
VVLAAGRGSRLDGQGIPKPLVTLRGQSLLERTVVGLAAAGVRRVVCVTGYKTELVAAAAHGLRIAGVTVETVCNPHWERPNGVSLAAAAAAVRGSHFVLTMSDHLFDPQIVRSLVGAALADGAVRLAVDRDIDGVFDLPDATKVLTVEDKIVDIGKSIPRFSAIDTGLFYCSRGIFDALEQSFARQAYNLSDGMRILASREQLLAMPVEGLYWQDVDDEAMLAKAEHDLVGATAQLVGNAVR